MIVLLEDRWEAHDIIEFCRNKQIECLVLSEKQLYERSDFLECVYFCNTDIVRFHLLKLLQHQKELLDQIYPDTYESVYSEYFKRKIRKTKMKSLENVLLKDKSIFVKPVGNDKSFDGRVVSSVSDIEHIMSDFEGDSSYKKNEFEHQVSYKKNERDVCDDVCDVYVCDVVEFLSENRLLIGNGKLYGYGHICKTKDFSFLSKIDINKLIEISGDNFRCIDVGLTKSGEWIIVEVNPPFSLDDYEIPLDMYMNFCIGACQWISKKVKINF